MSVIDQLPAAPGRPDRKFGKVCSSYRRLGRIIAEETDPKMVQKLKDIRENRRQKIEQLTGNGPQCRSLRQMRMLRQSPNGTNRNASPLAKGLNPSAQEDEELRGGLNAEGEPLFPDSMFLPTHAEREEAQRRAVEWLNAQDFE